jgi:hypothetical protein
MSEILFTDPRYGDKYSPIEWLQHIAVEFNDLADLWDYYDSNDIKDYKEEYISQEPERKPQEINDEIVNYIDDVILNEFNREGWHVAQDITQNRDNIVKAFENSVIFTNLLKSLGIIESLSSLVKDTEEDFWFQLYFSCYQTEEEVKEVYGEAAVGFVERFKKNPGLIVDDYEDAFSCITDFLETIEKKQFSEAIREASWAITGYCKFNDKNYSETQRKIAERYEKAYRSYQYAEEKTGNTLTDRQAYDYLKKHAVENIEGFMLPDFNTWQRYVRAGRRHYGAQKNTTRIGREIKSSIPVNDPDVKQITSKFDNPDSIETG